MTLESDLFDRADRKCELCASAGDLAPLDVVPHPGLPSLETHVLACGACRTGVLDPAAGAASRWYGLRESVWSEHAAVKVLAYRVLKALPGEGWALDLLGKMYMDDDSIAWANAGVSEDDDAVLAARDSNGTELHDGDSVTLIKDLDVKGAGFTAKRGTLVKSIATTGDPKYVEGNVNGIRIVLIAAYLKKA